MLRDVGIGTGRLWPHRPKLAIATHPAFALGLTAGDSSDLAEFLKSL